MKHITFSEQLQPLHKSRDKNMRHITSHVQMQSNQRRQTNRRYHITLSGQVFHVKGP